METGTVKKTDPLAIISKYYEPGSPSYMILVEHGRAVAKKALNIAQRLTHLTPDMEFIEEAAILHDIGIFMTAAPEIGCYGDEDYICHGFLGRELLEKEGLPAHALVCERHVGVGLTVDDVDSLFPMLPRRNMQPVSIEEKIICYADKFFSKRLDVLHIEKPLETVRLVIKRYGAENLQRFDEMSRLFNK